MKAFSENLLEGMAGALNERQHYYLTRIRFNAERLTGMINELLNVSQLEAGKTELSPDPVSLPVLLGDLLTVFRPLAEHKAIALEVTAAEGMPEVLADRRKLHEVLANLLDNAIKFTPPEGRIEIKAAVLNNQYLKVDVSDTGCGIPSEHLHRIFDKFYQVRSMPQNAGGAGLGLAIARGLIELHGGTITVDSVPGKGSRFSFTLPLKPASRRDVQRGLRRRAA